MDWLKRNKLQLSMGIVLGLLLVLFCRGMNSEVLAQTDPLVDTVPMGQYTIFQSIVLGIVQGITEFLPISSSAHLKLVPVALGWGDPGVTFTGVIQLGSIVALVWYFWGDLTDIITKSISAIRTKNYQAEEFRISLGIAIGTLPIIIFGVLVKLFIPDYDNSVLRGTTAIAITSIVMALLLGLAEYIGKINRGFEKLNTLDGIVIGLAQALAIIPGVSRSGATITTGLFIGLDRETSARFSFLLGIPAIVLVGLVELVELINQGFGNAEVIPIIVGTISSGIFSYLAIAWLLQYLQQQTTLIFVWYRLITGILVLVAVGYKALT